jgi:hypothetical protein
MRHLSPLLVVLGLSACATPPIVLDPGASAVKIAKSDPADNFEEVGPVSGFHGNGCGGFGYLGTYEGAVTNIKNNAHRMHANYVQIFTITEPHFRPGCFDNIYKLSGTAYRQVREMPSPTPIVEQQKKKTTAEKLADLQNLRSQNLISAEEYEKLRQEVLSKAY